MSKVYMYIDGNNLYRSARELGYTLNYKQLRGWLRQKYKEKAPGADVSTQGSSS